MADLIVVCGPQAVGKITVAECLRDRLHYNMMMNHDSIEISGRIFGFATPAQKEFNRYFREKAFALAVKHNVDLIFTCVCAFEMQEERDYLTNLHDTFTESGGGDRYKDLRPYGKRKRQKRIPVRRIKPSPVLLRELRLLPVGKT